ncbi:DNA-binding protein [Mangrovibacter sp. SLW1]
MLIIEQCASHMTASQIGALIGRSARSVSTWCACTGLPLRLHGERHPSARYANHDVELARELHMAGIGPREIAEKLELPFSAVKQFVYFERRVSA